LPIGEKSILEIQIARLKKYGFNEIILCTNYKSQYIENFFGDGSEYGINLIISKEEKPLGTVGPLTLVKEYLTEPFILMNGDILTLMDFNLFYKFSVNEDSPFTIAIKKYTFPFAFGNIMFDGNYVTGIEEKPEFEKYIIAGIYVMTPEIFSLVPDNQYYNMDELIMNMLVKKIPITKYELKEYWLDIGRIEDYKKAQVDYKKHFEKE